MKANALSIQKRDTSAGVSVRCNACWARSVASWRSYSGSPRPYRSDPEDPSAAARTPELQSRIDAGWHRILEKIQYGRGDPEYERYEEHTSELQSRIDLVCRL